MGERVHETLEDVVVVDLVQALQKAVVPLTQDLLDFFPGLVLESH